MSKKSPFPTGAAYSHKTYKASAILLAALALTPAASAQTVIGRANNANALDANNAWTGGVAPTSSEIAGFSSINTATSSTSTIAASVNFQIAGITFTNEPGTNLTIAGNTGSLLTLGASGINVANGTRVLTIAATAPVSLSANQTWTTGTAAASTSQIVVNSVISGTGGLTINGTSGSPLSPVYLNALNTFSGGVTLNSGGSLRLHGATAPVVSGGSVTSSATGIGNLTINGGTIFGHGSNGTHVAPTTTVNGDFAINNATSGLNGRFTFAGGTLDLSNGTRTVSVGRFTTALNAISGGQESIRFLQTSGAPTISVTNGNLRFVRGETGSATDFVSIAFGTGANFASGADLTIGQNVITTMATGNPFGAIDGAQPRVTVETGGYFNMSDATNARSPFIRTLSGAGTVTSLAAVGSATTATLTINAQTGDSTTFSGGIVNGSTLNASLGTSAANVSVAVTKTGSGTQIFSGSGLNTYSGATTINGGTLAIGANNALSANSAIILTAGTLNMQGFSASAPSLDFKGGQTISFDLGTAGNTTALLSLSGNFTKNSTGVFNLDLNGGQVGTYKLISFSGSTTFTSAGEFTALLDVGYAGNFTLNANDLSFTITTAAIPEPSSYAALAGLGVLTLAASRRRRTV
jgi:fibronectin-binding autotransporter adhesin